MAAPSMVAQIRDGFADQMGRIDVVPHRDLSVRPCRPNRCAQPSLPGGILGGSLERPVDRGLDVAAGLLPQRGSV